VNDLPNNRVAITAVAGQDVVCTFVNVAPGITIIKDTQPNSTQAFNFTVAGGGLPASFSLFDDGTNTNNSKALTNLVAGTTYTITEIPPADGSYSLSSITCTGGGTGSTVVATGTATITLAASEVVVCTFVNIFIGVNAAGASAGAAAAAASGLAFTGSDTRFLGVLGLTALAFGGLLLLGSRRRRRTTLGS
jgi:hypothetical protein